MRLLRSYVSACCVMCCYALEKLCMYVCMYKCIDVLCDVLVCACFEVMYRKSTDGCLSGHVVCCLGGGLLLTGMASRENLMVRTHGDHSKLRVVFF